MPPNRQRLSLVQSSHQKIKHNFGSNPYGFSQVRPTLAEELERALKGNMPYILLYGSPGCGKSSFLYNFAENLKSNESNEIEAILWFNCTDEIDRIYSTINSIFSIESSSKSQNGNPSSNFLNVLDTTRVSILIFDDISPQLLEFIKSKTEEIPTAYKIILTSRNNSIPIDDNQVYKIEVRNFSLEEWETAIRNTNRQEIRKWLDSFDDEGTQIIRQVYERLGGNIYAMMNVIARMASTRNPEIDIAIAINDNTELYDYLIRQTWNSLNDKAKQLLFAAALCCGTSKELQYSDLKNILEKLQINEQYYNELILECFQKFCLHCNLIQGIGHYTLDFLLNKFLVNYFFEGDSRDNSFNIIIKERIDFYTKKANYIGFCYDDTNKMQFFDDPENKEKLDLILAYCHKYDKDSFINITHDLRYFYYTRGIWTNDNENVHIRRAKLAEETGDHEKEFDAYVFYVNVAAKLNDNSELSHEIIRILEDKFMKYSEELKPNAIFNYKHALSLYDYSQNNFQKAMDRWNEIVSNDYPDSKKIGYENMDAAIRWLLKCKIKASKISSRKLIRSCKKRIKLAQKENFERAIIDYSLMLIDRYDNLAQSMKLISWKYKIKIRKLLQKIESLVKKENDALYLIQFYEYRGYYASDKKQIISDLQKALEKCRKTGLFVEKDRITNRIKNTKYLHELENEIGV